MCVADVQRFAAKQIKEETTQFHPVRKQVDFLKQTKSQLSQSLRSLTGLSSLDQLAAPRVTGRKGRTESAEILSA